jgi:succinyl-diaminopimelate desuccinylase
LRYSEEVQTLSPLHGLHVSADEPQASITGLLAELVQIPSRAGVDSCDRILGCIADWLKSHDVPCTALAGEDGRMVAFAGRLEGTSKGGAIILNATVDTAGFGDVAAWTHDPVGAQITNKCLYGRGSADAKAGIAIFCHLLAASAHGASRIGVGARGVWRATLHISGASAHSGSSLDRGTNAIAKATLLVESLAELQREMAPSPLRLYSQPVYQHHKM